MGTLTPAAKHSPLERLAVYWLQASRSTVLWITAGILLAISLADGLIRLHLSLGVLYLLPMMLGAVVLDAEAIFALAGICAILRWLFDYSPTSTEESILRFMFAAIAYSGSGFFVRALIRNRQMMVEHLQAIQAEQTLRRDAEDQLRELVQSSPAGILTLDSKGTVLAANGAANTIFGMNGDPTLKGRPVREYLPVLADALQLDIGAEPFHTAAQCQGRRQNGEIFLANTWFSTYRTHDGMRLAAIVVDSSEEMREREEENLRQLTNLGRITAAAVSHEMRNLCGAISLVYSNLSGKNGFRQDDGFQGLGTLVKGLETVAAMDLHARAQEALQETSLREVLNNLRIIVEPGWMEIDGKVGWHLPDDLPGVIADPHGLLQAFLNLAQNSQRAVEDCEIRELTISVAANGERVMIRFEDTGPGISSPQPLFQPFQEGAELTGMGLYISRAILRSFGGDLRYESGGRGACFAVELQAAHHEVAR